MESVIAQISSDFEWIIIDGGSTDGSRELIEDHSKYISYFVSEPDNGIYNAMNKGIVASHGDYLQFLNSGDSLYEKDTIEKVFKNNESTAIQSDFSPEGILDKLTFTWIPHQASFFKSSIFKRYGLYREDQKIVSDWWFYYRSLVLGNASIESLPFNIAYYDTNGISHTHRSQAIVEQEMLLNEYPAISTYYHFYKDNKDIVKALKANRLSLMLFRFYYYLYRKFH